MRLFRFSGVERSLLVRTIAHLAESLRTLFTSTADAIARRSGFVERTSTLTGALFAQALVFGWLANPDASLPQLAAAAALAGVSISPQGLDQRCTEAAACFLESLLAAAVLVQADTVASPLLARFSAVELLDASTIVLPDALGLWWPGCGGASPVNTSASLKIHVRFDWCSGALRGPLLTDGRTHESTTPLQTAPLPRGALRVADLGYFCLAVLAAIAAEGSYFLSRMHHTTAVFTPAGQRTRLLALLGPAPSDDLSVHLGCTQRLPVRLLAVRVPPEVANARRRHLKTAARTPTAESLAWADWTLLVTNATADLLRLPEALVLLRARWQLEICHPEYSHSDDHWRLASLVLPLSHLTVTPRSWERRFPAVVAVAWEAWCTRVVCRLFRMRCPRMQLPMLQW